jgi:ATP-dependent DNA helicase RecG
VKLSEGLDAAQKVSKISNLLTKLRRRGIIVNKGSKKSPSWKLSDELAE